MHVTSFLDNRFKSKLDALLWVLGDKYSQEYTVYQMIRDPWTQARYYRQSRTTEQIQRKIESLRARGTGYFANILHEVGPQYGPRLTGAGPGESWHQYGFAVDVFRRLNGRACWGKEYYPDLVNESCIIGLTNGANFRTPDPYHLQMFDSRVSTVTDINPRTFAEWEELAISMYGFNEFTWQQFLDAFRLQSNS